MNSTASGTIQGLDFTGLFLGALLKPVRAQLDTFVWLKWPYWNYVFIGLGAVIILWVLFWFWSNWIR